LQGIVKEKKLDNQVVFVDKYMTLEEIIHYLQATDIFVHTSYILNMASSGTLTYAIIAGKCIISTPFFYAKEVLKKNGILVPVNDSKKLAKEIINILSNPTKKQEIENKMYKFGRSFVWPKIGEKYLSVIKKIK